MKTTGPLQKPPPLILPVPGAGRTRSKTNEYSKPSFFKSKQVTPEETAVHQFTSRYDSYQGLLRKVSEMKLSGSLDSEDQTESESSSVRTRSSGSHCQKCDDSSPYNNSPTSSFHGDCPPYEEIPTVDDEFPLPPAPVVDRSSITSYRGRSSFPEPPTPTAIYNNEPPLARRRPSSLYSNGEVEEGCFRIPRPQSMYCNTAEVEQTYINTDRNSTSNETSDDVTDDDKLRIDTFFRGLRTNLYVCGSFANMYLKEKDNWSFQCTGIPLVLLESGDTKARLKKRIQIILAEKGTAFPLWTDTIDNLSAYRKSDPAFHTMCLSRNHKQVIGLSFNSDVEADKFLQHIEHLTSNPENINISVPGIKKKSQKPKKPAPLPEKKAISTPCYFQHVTKVSSRDAPIYFSLQNYVENTGEERRTKN